MSARCMIMVLARGMSRPIRRCWSTAARRTCRHRRRHDVFQLGRRHLAMRDRRSSSPAPARAGARSRAGRRCAGDIEALAAAIFARAAAPRAPPPGSKGVTKVRTASRSTGGVAIRTSRARPTAPSAGCAGSAWRSGSAHGRRPQGLQPLLVLDAEMLFLVDDHQAQPLELDAWPAGMGADHDIDLPSARPSLVSRAPWHPPGATAAHP
jgi:hypothetical protein